MKIRDTAFICSVIVFVFLLSIAYAQEDQTSEKVTEAKNSVTELELLENVRFLADKNMAGRGTRDKGYEHPSLFIERELREYGFAPLGDDLDPKDPLNCGASRSYFQQFKLRGNMTSRNIVGFIEGEKANEFIIIGAHYDHLGLGYDYNSTERNPEGKIHYGADDNASGTAAVLEIAEAYGVLAKSGIKPKRSIVIGLWGAEELGLLGSEYFVELLPVEIGRRNIVCAINLDMVGRNKDSELFIIADPKGVGLGVVCPELHEINWKINRQKEFGFNIRYSNDGFDASDQFSFYGAMPPGDRIPVIFYFTGMHPDYHKTTDTWEKINYPKLTRIARLTFLVSWEIAELKDRPKYRD